MISARRAAVLCTVGALSLALSGCAQLQEQWDKVFTPDVTATRSADGTVATAGTENVHTVRVGDCLEGSPSGAVSAADVVPCDESHAGEVFGLVPLRDASYPVGDAMDAHAWAACEPLFEPYVGAPTGTSAFELFALAPSRESWDAGDKRVVCLLRSADGSVLTGSAKSAGS